MAKEPKENKGADNGPDAAPSAPVEAVAVTPKAERQVYDPFAPGEPLSYTGKQFEGVDKPVDAVFRAADGQEYPAKILPLPKNKGALGKISKALDQDKILARVNAIKNPLQKSEALKKALAEMQEEIPALVMNGEAIRLVEIDGRLYRLMDKGEDGEVAVADLKVNFGLRPDAPRWVYKQNVLHASHAGTPGKGKRWTPNFRTK